MRMVLAGAMARRREPDCMHHGEKMATIPILGDAAPSAQNALVPHRCVRRDARQHDPDRYIQWWHGATTTTAMTHIAIQEALDGKVVEWMEKVSDEQYQA